MRRSRSCRTDFDRDHHIGVRRPLRENHLVVPSLCCCWDIKVDRVFKVRQVAFLFEKGVGAGDIRLVADDIGAIG